MKRLLTWTITIDENGPEDHNIISDVKCGDIATFSDVYRGFVLIQDELERVIKERRLCPENPKYGKGMNFDGNV